MACVRGVVVTEGGMPVTTFHLNGELFQHPEGAFELCSARGGQERLVFAADGLASTMRIINIEPAEAPLLIEIVLTQGQLIRGRVVDAVSREPIADALVDVSESEVSEQYETSLEKEWGAVSSQDDGSFVLPVEKDTPTLIVTHEKYPQVWIPLQSQRSELVVELDPGSVLKGAVKESSFEGAALQLVRQDGAVSRSSVVKEGAYVLEGIPAGRYFLTAWDPCAPSPRHPFFGEWVEIPGRGVVVFNIE